MRLRSLLDDSHRRGDQILRGFRQFAAPACVIMTYDRVLAGDDAIDLVLQLPLRCSPPLMHVYSMPLIESPALVADRFGLA